MPNTTSAQQAIRAMLRPASIAVVGATDRLQYGGRLVNNLLQGGFTGKLYPVNPKRERVFGLPCFPSVAALPEPVDSVAIVIPASGVLASLQECAQRGVKAAVIISAGFAELGDARGQQLQSDLRRLARESGVRVCGPNCLGIGNVAEGIWTTSTLSVEAGAVVGSGPVGLVSQSGATAYGPLMALAKDRGIGFRYVVSTGNEADLEVSDFAEFMLDDPEVKSLALMCEGLRDGQKFLRMARRALTQGKPLTVLKLGRSPVGAAAARTHTGALTGSDEVLSALFRQAGVVRADDYDDLLETANMFAKARVPAGERLGLVSHSGGICGAIGDKCGEMGLAIPALSERTVRRLEEILEGRGAATNPADITYHFMRDTFPVILQAMLEDDSLDLLGVATAGSEQTANAVIQAASTSAKPVLFMWTEGLRNDVALPGLQQSPVPVFYLPGRFAKGIRALIDYRRARLRHAAAGGAHAGEAMSPARATKRAADLAALLCSTSAATLDEHRSKAALSLYGIPATREVLCQGAGEAISAAASLGYPVAIKAVSASIPHKTEARVVRLGVRTQAELTAAWEEVLANARRHAPAAAIEGVLVQEMVSGGVEVIAGLSWDPQFGPVLLFGLGGVLVEALGAVSRRLCPIAPDDAREMIAEVKGMERILGGYRGRPEADVDALMDVLCRLSWMGVEAGHLLSGVDVNPLAVLPKGQGARALDALVVARERGTT